MPSGIGSWRRRENSGRFVGSRLLEERRGLSFRQAKHRMKWIHSGSSDPRKFLGRRFGANSTIGPLSNKWADAGKHYGVTRLDPLQFRQPNHERPKD